MSLVVTLHSDSIMGWTWLDWVHACSSWIKEANAKASRLDPFACTAAGVVDHTGASLSAPKLDFFSLLFYHTDVCRARHTCDSLDGIPSCC